MSLFQFNLFLFFFFFSPPENTTQTRRCSGAGSRTCLGILIQQSFLKIDNICFRSAHTDRWMLIHVPPDTFMFFLFYVLSYATRGYLWNASSRPGCSGVWRWVQVCPAWLCCLVHVVLLIRQMYLAFSQWCRSALQVHHPTHTTHRHVLYAASWQDPGGNRSLAAWWL